MSPAPHADRDHSEAPETPTECPACGCPDECAEGEMDRMRAAIERLESKAASVDLWAAASCRWQTRAEAAEAERDRARSLAATLEARLAQEQAKVARVQEVVIEHWPEIPGDALMAALEESA